MLKTLWNTDWSFSKTSLDITWEDRAQWEQGMRPVDLPHDWLIYDTLNLYEDSIGWYRKRFTCEEPDDRYILRFDGIYMDYAVYLNGEKLGEWKYGYSTADWDLTGRLHEGENEIVVSVRHQAPNSRWYSGAGIYRNVWLTVLSGRDAFLLPDGIYATTAQTKEGYTLRVDTELAPATARISSCDYGSTAWGAEGAADIRGHYELEYFLAHETDAGYEVVLQERQLVADDAAEDANLPGGVRTSAFFAITQPRLWDIEDPHLYELTVRLYARVGESAFPIQEGSCRIGFRTTEYLPEQGFLLNGRKVRLNGACDHHDLGALGAAFHKEAMRRKLLLMRTMGVNALRTSHNMPAPEVMEMADEMGILVIAEAFDMWEMAKNPYDYARFFPEWAERDVRSWVRRDRNHPSVILWSIGNEIPDTHASEHGEEITRRLMSDVRVWDPLAKAPVTIGSNYMPWQGAQNCADIVKLAGYNYAEKYYEEHHAKYPDWVIYGSETSSVVQSRGVYHFPLERATLIEEDEQCSSLGNSTTSWAAKNTEFPIIADRDTPYSCGQFIWTAIDYIGEPTPYQTKNSYFGQMDTAGFPKDSYYIYRAEWTDATKAPFVHVYPYWDFSLGQPVDVRIASNAAEVELLVDGVSQGRRSIDHAHGQELVPSWKVPYAPGELTAIAYDKTGRVIAKERRHSFGDTARLVLHANKDTLRADGEDMLFVEITAEDADGYPVENAMDYVRVTVEGAARLVGLDNGDSTDYDSYKGCVRKLFNGKLLAMLAARTMPGEICVRVEPVTDGETAGVETAEDGAVEGKAAEGKAVQGAELLLTAVKAQVPEGICASEENRDVPPIMNTLGSIPVRKLELVVREEVEEEASFASKAAAGGMATAAATAAKNREAPEAATVTTAAATGAAAGEAARNAVTSLELSPDRPSCIVDCRICPDNATDRELLWKAVDVSGMKSLLVDVEELPDGRSVRLTGKSDGTFLLRCSSKSGTDKIKLISQVEFTVTGMGEAYRSVYEPILGLAYTQKEGDLRKGADNSVGTDRERETWLVYENLDFGAFGSDELVLNIFADDDPHEIALWLGVPGSEGSRQLAVLPYHKPSIWEVFQPESYALPERIDGVQTITFVTRERLFLKDFTFTRKRKAYEKLYAGRDGVTYGDSFVPAGDAIERIGNNVSLAFDGMDFGEEGATHITICGRTPLPANTVQLRFEPTGEGEASTQVVAFPHSEEYMEQTFELSTPVYGAQKVTFVFLPGCNFDFAWFRFKR